MKGFPLQNLLPSLLIVLVVNSDDIIHISLTNIVILPLPPKKEHAKIYQISLIKLKQLIHVFIKSFILYIEIKD